MHASLPYPVLDLDPFSDEFLRDPFPYHERIRDAGPIVWLERYAIWAVARHDEVFAALLDFDTFISSAGVGITDFRRETPPRPPSIILEADPPLQTRTHKILARVLSPGALRSMRTAFEREAETLVERILGNSVVDGATDIAQAFPMKVFPDAVPQNARFAEAMSCAPEVSKQVNALCQRSAISDDGLAAGIFAAHDAGECTYDEACMLVRSLLSAGLDTTVNSLACTLICFARYPEQWQRVRSNPSLARAAFDEAIRLESPVQTFFRTAGRPTAIGETALEDGAKLLMFLGSANRDPRKWTAADSFDVTRKTGAHVGFGAGIHRCVGEMLSKLEGESLITALARRIDRFELTAAPTVRIIIPFADTTRFRSASTRLSASGRTGTATSRVNDGEFSHFNRQA